MGIEKSRPVLITGCSTGIGRATAERLAADGWNVHATARRPDSIEDLAKTCTTHALDVTDERSMEEAVAAVEEDGPVGALVNNAGYSQSGAIETIPMESVRRQFETNVFGLMRMCQLVLPRMRAAGSGRIVNLSSMGGKLTFPGRRRLPRDQARGRGPLGCAALRGPRVRRRRRRHRARPDHHRVRRDRRRQPRRDRRARPLLQVQLRRGQGDGERLHGADGALRRRPGGGGGQDREGDLIPPAEHALHGDAIRQGDAWRAPDVYRPDVGSLRPRAVPAAETRRLKFGAPANDWAR
jgi:NAD(P)-dependent dehydrogenase (short-subunit alcohol dehydrogenase family)